MEKAWCSFWSPIGFGWTGPGEVRGCRLPSQGGLPCSSVIAPMRFKTIAPKPDRNERTSTTVEKKKKKTQRTDEAGMSVEETRRLLSSLFALQRFYLPVCGRHYRILPALFLLRRYFSPVPRVARRAEAVHITALEI